MRKAAQLGATATEDIAEDSLLHASHASHAGPRVAASPAEIVAEGSSLIRSFSYDEGSELLQIRFTDGHLGRFQDAPKYLYLGLQCARSVDKFYQTIIAPRYKKVPVYRLDEL